MWPLCHVAHVRPVFRASDWEHYREVNQRFADAVVAEARSEDPVVLVQDYHFALLPRMIRERLPRATILTFWHIPWPNPESFGICPWRREILEGMLGSTILGFHTRFHCKNFLETVDRYLEARIEHEHSTISFQATETLVESYPISIEWPPAPIAGELAAGRRMPAPPCSHAWSCRRAPARRRRRPLRLHQGHPRTAARGRAAARKASGVDRHASRFVQVAAPTRSSLEEYRSSRNASQRLPSASTSASAGPATSRDPAAGRAPRRTRQVNELYRAADVCLVTSLHDGMNLVSKEFVAARDDEQGVLILSRFAGAARELHRGADRQPVPRRGVRRRAAPGAATMPPRRAARAHGAACA